MTITLHCEAIFQFYHIRFEYNRTKFSKNLTLFPAKMTHKYKYRSLHAANFKATKIHTKQKTRLRRTAFYEYIKLNISTETLQKCHLLGRKPRN